MKTINITPSQTKVLEIVGLGIEFNYVETTRPNGEVEIVDSVEIYDECSDFTVIYTISKSGALQYYCSPENIEDLPALISSTKELTAVCKYVAKAA